MADYIYYFIYGGYGDKTFDKVVILSDDYPDVMADHIAKTYKNFYATDFFVNLQNPAADYNKILEGTRLHKVTARAAYTLINEYNVPSYWHRKGKPPTSKNISLFL